MISLTQMARLVRALINAEERVANAEKLLKENKEKVRVLKEESIPSAMHELGLEKLKLDTGQEISIKQDVYASIPKAEKEAAYRWLTDNGYGGLIKLDVTAKFGREESVVASAVYEKLIVEGHTASLTQNINAQTLKAFLREQITKATNIPLDLFGARPIWTTKIKN